MIKKIVGILIIITLIVACDDEEISTPITKEQVQFLLQSDSSKQWDLIDDGSGNYDPCTEGLIYQFERTTSDTSLLYRLRPRLLCVADTIPLNDTISIWQWTITDTSGTVFDGSLSFFNADSTFQAVISDPIPTELTIEFLFDPPVKETLSPR